MKQVVDELLAFLSPVANALESPENLQALLGALGYAPGQAGLQAAMPALQPIGAELATLLQLGDELSAQPGELSRLDPSLIEFVQAVAALIARWHELPGLLAGLVPDDFLPEMLDLLIVEYLQARFPAVVRLLVLLDVARFRFVPAAGDPDSRGADFTHIHLEWSKVRDLFSDPKAWAEATYGWGTSEFDHALFLHRLATLCDTLGRYAYPEPVSDEYLATFLPSRAGDPNRPVAARLPLWRHPDSAAAALEIGLQAAPVDSAAAGDTQDVGIGLMPYATGAADGTAALDARWKLVLRGKAGIDGGVVLALRPHSGVEATAGLNSSTAVDVGDWLLQLRLDPEAGKSVLHLFGDAAGTRLQAKAFLIGVGGKGEDLFVAGGFEALELVIDLSENELLSLLVPQPITVKANDLLLGWRPGRGLYFEHGAGLALHVPLALALDAGAIRLRLHGVGVQLGFAPETSLGLSVDFDLTLGPLTLGAQGLGLELALANAADGSGRFGRFDARAGPLFPTGYAVGFDGGPLAGGGALVFEEGGFRGALALRFGSFGISAFALMTTRLPSGAQGFSFLATLFVEFELQLGYGFKLTGLGGLLGLHRTCQVEALRTLLLAGNLDSLLFPEDPVRDALQVLNDLASVYPPAEGQYLVGPAIKIAWGTPTLIEGKLAVIVEFGAFARVLILGSVGSALPTKEAAIVVLKVDFVGLIDFDRGAISFDATLAGSRLLDWPISGEMAVRTGWGPSAGLVAAIGGLHPQVSVPPGFPTLQRVTINFGSNNPSLTLKGYVGLTLACVQAGARASLFFKGPDILFVGQLEVEGQAWFDALVHFDPFHFEAELGLSIHLLIDGDTICGIGGDLRISGPNTYRLKGKAWVDVLGLELSIGVDKSWGHALGDAAQSVDALALLKAELDKGLAWEVVPPRARVSGVRFAKLETPAGGGQSTANVPLDPSGGLNFQQRAMPLGVALERIGTARLASKIDTLDLQLLAADGSVLSARELELDFVRAHFFDLDDDEKLRGQALEPFKGGLSIHGPDELVRDIGSEQAVDLDYETIFLGDEPSLLAPVGGPLRVPAAWERSGLAARAKPLRADRVPVDLTRGLVRVSRSAAVVVESTGAIRRAATTGAAAREQLRAGQRFGERWLLEYLAVPPSGGPA